MKKLLLTLSLLTGLLITQTSPAWAAVAIDSELRPDNAPQGYSELYNPEPANDAENFTDVAITYIIADIAVVLLQISGALAIFFVILNGFNYIKAFGQEEEIQKAKKGLTWALIGFILVILSYAIVQNVIRLTLSVDNTESTTEGGETEAHLYLPEYWA